MAGHGHAKGMTEVTVIEVTVTEVTVTEVTVTDITVTEVTVTLHVSFSHARALDGVSRAVGHRTVSIW